MRIRVLKLFYIYQGAPVPNKIPAKNIASAKHAVAEYAPNLNFSKYIQIFLNVLQPEVKLTFRF